MSADKSPAVASRVEQVKRNLEKFSAAFMFQLVPEEAAAVQRSRAQIVILKRGWNVKYLPYAFTEHGAIMAANVLNSPRAVEISVCVVRAFVRLRQWPAGHAELSRRLDDRERKHDSQFTVVFEAIRHLMTPPARKRKQIGFHVREPHAVYTTRRKG
jgi:hypothetical protein